MRNPTFLLAIALALSTAPLAAGSILFDNFPINGNISALEVDGSNAVSDSFTLNASADVTGVNFGAWLTTGDSVTSTGWSIGTSAYDSSLGSGLASTSTTFDFSNSDGFDVDAVSFSTPSVLLPAGTYYLTLTGAISAADNPVYWDINNTPGIDVWDNSFGNLSAGSGVSNGCFNVVGISGSCASSFQIMGSASASVPEPSTAALFGAGVLAVAALRRRRIHR